MSVSSGTAAGQQAAGAVEAEDHRAAALLLAARASAAARGRLPGSSPGAALSLGSGGVLSPFSEDGTDEMNEQQGQGLAGLRNSGSLSNLDPSEWRGGDSLGPPQQQAFGGSYSQQQYQQQQQAYMQALGAGEQDGDDTPGRGRRNAKQQEQNKQAQQRYRAKRKAQFEDLQQKVAHLAAEASSAQRLRQENDRLRAETAKLRAMLQAGSASAAAAPNGGTAGTLTQSGPGSSTGLPDVLAPQQQTQQQQPPGQQRQHNTGSNNANNNNSNEYSPMGPKRLALAPPAGGSSGLARAAFGGNGAFKPTAAARPLAAATLAELPVLPNGGDAAAQPPLLPAVPAPAQQQAAVLQPTGRHVHAALDLFYSDLQGFASLVHLEQVPSDGSGLGAAAAMKLTELVRTGIELAKMVLQTSGPEAAALLTAGLPPVGADGVSPADSLTQWRMVASRVVLAPDQLLLLADWRSRFLQKLDDVYGRRLLHKAQLAQLPASADDSSGGAAGAGVGQAQAPQWVEALLLQAAEGVGFSACALACAQLEGVVGSLADNVREERAIACAMMAELLDRLLTKVQAARFLLAGHPFCWNGLSFALAAASMAPPAATLGQEQPPLTQLLARLQPGA